MSKPKLVFAMNTAKTEHVFSGTALDRLSDITQVLDPRPLENFIGERADRLLAEAEILVTGWGCPPINGAVLERAPKLKLIAHAAGTVKYFLAPEVFARGIAVTHAAEANAQPVAEFTLAAILFAGKRVFDFRDKYCADRDRSETDLMLSQPIGNYRRTVGLIGASRIGRRVIELLKPFGLHVLLSDPYVDGAEARALGVELVGLDALMARADIVSLHAPVLPATIGMIGARQLALMADGTTFINTARGALVDQAALIAELETGRIDAVIDVTDPEVPGVGSPLYRLPNVFLTPHIAGAIGLERMRLGDMITDEIGRFVADEPLLYGVGFAMLERLA